MASIDEGLLIIDGILIPIHNYFKLSQDFFIIGGSFTRRSLDGSLRKQTHWQKLGTTISASGSLPIGLTDVDFSGSYEIHSAAFRSIKSTSRVILLSGSWRVDSGYVPRGFGLVGSEWVETSYVESPAGTFTLAEVVGASSYELRFWPILTVMSDPPSENNDVHGRDSTWSITAEEV